MPASREVFTPDNLGDASFPRVGQRAVLQVGQNLIRGSILGRVLFSCPTSGTAGSNTGNGTVTLVRAGAKVKIGTYTIICAHVAATFSVFNITDPDSLIVGTCTVGIGDNNAVKFGSEQIQLQILNGTTDFAANDSFTVAVSQGIPTTGTIAGTGNGTCVQVEARRLTTIGSYVATCVEAISGGGRFEVVDPNSNVVGTAYASKFVGTGNGTLTEIKAGPRFNKAGPYLITCTAAGTTHGGTFSVTDPNGVVIGSASLPDTASGTVVFSHEQISFKLTDGGTNFTVGAKFTLYWFESDAIAFVIWDGSTDFVLTDTATITTTISQKQCKIVDRDNTDGSNLPYAVLAESCDASLEAKEVPIFVAGKFNERELSFGGNDTIEHHRDNLRVVGIFTDSSGLVS